MSIIVKGMKMPETCMRCDFLRFYNVYCCGLLVKKIDNGKRRDDCPLVEVPPHGRLIDVSVAYDKIAEAAGEESGNYVDMDVVDRGLSETPTIIEAEE